MSEDRLAPDARTRAANLFEGYAGAVVAHLAAKFPQADLQTITDAVVRAILDVSTDFERFDPERGSLATFLAAAAERVLLTLLRSDGRRRRREQKKAIDPVTAVAPAARSPLDELADRELAQRVRALLGLTPEEGRALDLWLLGEKELGAYAAALGLNDRPRPEQERQVKQTLARLRQRIHRAGGRLRPQEGDE